MKGRILPIFLFVLSATVGLLAALPGAIALFFYTTGAWILLLLVTLLFMSTLVLWQTSQKKQGPREPERLARHQGYLFNLWFASHNLFWAFTASFAIWGLFRVFGPRGWVMICGAGAFACTGFAIFGTFISGKKKMLGLCWSSSIPDGIKTFWDHTGATFILHCRYQQAVQRDQKQTYPLIWAISRVYDRTASGGAQRGVELWHPGLPRQMFKKEWQHRAKVLASLFGVTVALAVLTVLFGLTAQQWNQVPKGWPTGQLQVYTHNQEKNNNRENIDPEISRGYNEKYGQSGEVNDIKIQGNESTAVEENTRTGSRTQTSQQGKDSQPGRETQSGQQTQIHQEGQNQQGEQTQPGQQAQLRQGGQTPPGQQTQLREGEQTQSGQQAKLQQGQQTQQGQPGQQAQLRQGQQAQSGQQRQQAKLQQGQQTQQGQQAQLRQGQQAQSGQQGQQTQLRQGQQAQSGQQRQQAKLQQGQQTQPGQQGQQTQLRQGQQAQLQQGQQAQLRQGQQAQSRQQGQQAKLQQGQQTQLRQGQQAQSGQQGQQTQLQQGQQTQSGQQGQQTQSGQQGQQAQLQQGQQTQSRQQGQQAQLQQGQQTQSGQQGRQTQAGTQGQQAQERAQGEKGQVGSGKGEGQGSGSRNHIPETASTPDPKPEPPLPSRSTPMVTVKIPPLPAAIKDGNGESLKDNSNRLKPAKKYSAPVASYKTGKQNNRSSSPEQYLPNWILNITSGQKTTASNAKNKKPIGPIK